MTAFCSCPVWRRSVVGCECRRLGQTVRVALIAMRRKFTSQMSWLFWARTFGATDVHAVTLGRALAAMMCHASLRVFHIVPITGKVKQSQLLGSRPSRRQTNRAEAVEAPPDGGRAPGRVLVYKKNQLPADLVLDWLRSVRYIQNQNQKDE